MKQSSVGLLGLMTAMSTTSVYTNAYENFTDETTYVSHPTRKTQLTKKQVKARHKNKLAKIARKKQRR